MRWELEQGSIGDDACRSVSLTHLAWEWMVAGGRKTSGDGSTGGPICDGSDGLQSEMGGLEKAE